MRPDWLFSSEHPLPLGLEIISIANASKSLGVARLGGASEIVGKPNAETIAKNLGRYQLTDELAAQLKNDGLKLKEGNEIPALSPENWVDVDSGSLKDRQVVGVALTADQSTLFLEFLARNRVSADTDLDPEKVIALARHFFFEEPILAVVRYTGPRFAQA